MKKKRFPAPEDKPYWHHDDYRDLLKTEFHIRILRNRRYSLRAYARDIGLSPAMLSQVLSSKAGISTPRGRQIAGILNFEEPKTNYFLDLIDSVEAKNPHLRRLAKDRIREARENLSIREVPLNDFSKIEEWHHIAIFVMANFPGFKFDAKRIAQQL